MNTATPTEIDTQLAALYRSAEQVRHSVDSAQSFIVRMEFDNRTVSQSFRDELAAGEARLISIAREMAPLNAEFARRGGWTRAFIVPNGHIHSNMACNTCYASTRFGWLPQVSGMDEAEIVSQAGEKACTVCYPTAPVNMLRRPCRLNTPEALAEKDAKAAEKARKAAEKTAKGITKPDGTPLYEWDMRKGVAYETTYEIKTEVSAARKATEAAFDLLWYRSTHPDAPAWRATVDHCVAALAHKRGVLEHSVRADVERKAQAKYKREMR